MKLVKTYQGALYQVRFTGRQYSKMILSGEVMLNYFPKFRNETGSKVTRIEFKCFLSSEYKERTHIPANHYSNGQWYILMVSTLQLQSKYISDSLSICVCLRTDQPSERRNNTNKSNTHLLYFHDTHIELCNGDSN